MNSPSCYRTQEKPTEISWFTYFSGSNITLFYIDSITRKWLQLIMGNAMLMEVINPMITMEQSIPMAMGTKMKGMSLDSSKLLPISWIVVWDHCVCLFCSFLVILITYECAMFNTMWVWPDTWKGTLFYYWSCFIG